MTVNAVLFQDWGAAVLTQVLLAEVHGKKLC